GRCAPSRRPAGTRDRPGSSGDRPGGPDAGAATGGPVPQPRSGGEARDRQPVRTAGDGSRSGPARTMETADRVTSMVPPEVTGVDQVVTPDGTMVTAAADESVDTPPLPGTAGR
ncbi:hypothetical protein, partial [Micromonospora sp. NPDC003776]